MNPDKLSNYIQSALPYTLDLLKQMVEINSFTKNKDGVNKLGKITAGAFAYLGFKASFVPCTNELYGEHLIMEREGSSNITIGLISHLDTVYTAEEEERNNFSWREEGDKIYGPGTIDIKGGTAMIYLVLSTIREMLPELYQKVNWKILINAAEEVLTPDFGDLSRERLKDACAALVFEFGPPASNDTYFVTSARKGRIQYNLEVFGRSAHAGSEMAKGASAILQMTHCINILEKLNDPEKGVSVNIGLIKGGVTRNRVPEYAYAEVEMRAYDQELCDKTDLKILDLVNQVDVRSQKDNFPCEIKIYSENRRPPWDKNEKSESLVEIWREAASSVGLKLSSQTRGGLSDGNFLWDLLPTLDGLGPFGGNAHCAEHSTDGLKEQEFVLRSSFAPKALINVLAIKSLVERQ